MEAALLWRFHSLGDVVLCTGVAAALAQRLDLRVATEARYRPVFAGLWPEERILTREALASPSCPLRFEQIVDLQGTPGSRRLARRLGRRSRSVRTRAAARRWLVIWGERFPRPRIPHAVERYAAAAGLDPFEAAVRYLPRVVVTEEDETTARQRAPEAFAPGAGPTVALAVGASRRTKEIPPETFRALAGRLAADGIRVWWIAPPDSGSSAGETGAAPAAGFGAALAPGFAPAAGIAATLRLPLGPLKATLARADLVVSCDSGLMHLASALDRPVLGLFAGTVPSFGFAPCGPLSGHLEVAGLSCRPCGVHGRKRCWLGHWRCARELTAERIAAEVRRRLGEGAGRTRERVPSR